MNLAYDDDDGGLMRGRGDVDRFTMPSSWARDPRLSLAALGFLARLRNLLEYAERDERVTVGQIVMELDDPAQVRQIMAELRHLGYIVADRLVDPFAEELERRQRERYPDWFLPRSQEPPRSTSVVYYIRRTSDGAVKIGHTSNLRKRVNSLRRLYGDIDVLAVEPGGKSVEDRRHAEFADLQLPPERNVGGTEWFRFGESLIRHVSELEAAA